MSNKNDADQEKEGADSLEDLLNNPEELGKKFSDIASAFKDTVKDTGLFVPKKMNRKITLNVEFTIKDE